MPRYVIICAVIASFFVGVGLSWVLHSKYSEELKKADKLQGTNYSDHYKIFKQNPIRQKQAKLTKETELPSRGELPNETTNLLALQIPKATHKFRPKETQKNSMTQLVAFNNSPFPYEGVMPHNGKKFLNFEQDGKPAHKTPSGRVYFAEQTYNEQRVLLHIPDNFNPNKPAIMVMFFHGHRATLERDIIARQKVPEQISKAGVNAVLVAPQFAKDARDSSPGKFWKPKAAKKFVEETQQKLAKLYNKPAANNSFKNMPIVIIGYSGGFLPTAWALARGGIDKQVKAVVLLDGLYNHLSTFTRWIKNNRQSIFVSAYTNLTKKRNEALQERLDKEGISYRSELNGALQPGHVVFQFANEDHHHYVTNAWAPMPIKDVLQKLNRTIPDLQS